MIIYDIDHIEEVYKTTYDKYSAARKLAREYGVKPSDIFQVLQDNGIIGGEKMQESPATAEKEKKGKKKCRDPYSKEEIDLITELRAEGKTWGEIEDITGRPAKSMSNLFSKKKGKPAKAQQNAADLGQTEKVKKKIDKVLDEPEQTGIVVTGREPRGYELTFAVDGMFFRDLNAAYEFIEGLKEKGCELKQLSIFERNKITFEIKGDT